MKLDLNQFWECPVCGTQAAMGTPAVMHPPTCAMGHPKTECEQKTAEAWQGPDRWDAA